MTEPSTATHEIADGTLDELPLATELYDRARDVDPALVIAEITACLAAARRAGFAAGLEERADEAHLAGYREGYADGMVEGASIAAGAE